MKGKKASLCKKAFSFFPQKERPSADALAASEKHSKRLNRQKASLSPKNRIFFPCVSFGKETQTAGRHP
ncbi:MAG: hypothetical protein LIP00_12695 [Parabacteroides sp.]|nr:hypothetical protein [Parabacteroides sp.]